MIIHLAKEFFDISYWLERYDEQYAKMKADNFRFYDFRNMFISHHTIALVTSEDFEYDSAEVVAVLRVIALAAKQREQEYIAKRDAENERLQRESAENERRVEAVATEVNMRAAKVYIDETLTVYQKQEKFAQMMTTLEAAYRISQIASNDHVPAGVMRVYKRISEMRFHVEREGEGNKN